MGLDSQDSGDLWISLEPNICFQNVLRFCSNFGIKPAQASEAEVQRVSTTIEELARNLPPKLKNHTRRPGREPLQGANVISVSDFV